MLNLSCRSPVFNYGTLYSYFRSTQTIVNVKVRSGSNLFNVVIRFALDEFRVRLCYAFIEAVYISLCSNFTYIQDFLVKNVF